MVKLALAVATLAACTVERDVLSRDGGPVTDCDAVWTAGEPGHACDLAMPCTRPSPLQPECCTDFAYCRMGELVKDTTCNPDCAPCIDDSQCQPGAAICNGGVCEPCALMPPCDPMTMCPPGWQFLTRNGCPTCECAPPDECAPGPDGTTMCDPATGTQCYGGANCVDGCPPAPGNDCCADACSTPGCMEPAPLGCFMDCDPAMGMCSTCASTACECDNGNWSCQPVCLDGTMVALPCVVPN